MSVSANEPHAHGSDAATANAPPSGAVHDDSMNGWVLCERDGEDRLHGDFALYRDDGSLSVEGQYEHGVRNGSFTSYHPSGDVASVARFVSGKPEGELIRYASATPGALPLRTCCVPPSSQQLRQRYRDGRCVFERFFDGEGRALRNNGQPLPERPLALPQDTDFDDGSDRWVWHTESPAGNSLQRYYDLTGARVEEVEALGDRRVARRLFDDEGLSEERLTGEKGRLHGSYFKRYPNGKSPYRDAAIRQERGTFDGGRPVGSWTFLAHDDSPLVRIDRGPLPSTERLLELCHDDLSGLAEGELRDRIRSLLDRSLTREALFVAARAAGKLRETALLQDVLQKCTVALTEAQLDAWTQALERSHKMNLGSTLDALLSGARPENALRVLSTLSPGGCPASLELIEAALLCDPTSERCTITRSLLRLEGGNVEGALADASRLSDVNRSAARVIEDTARIVFAPGRFTVPAERPEPNPELPAIAVEQTLNAIRRAVALYATRIGKLRSHIQERLNGAEPEWLPPDLSALLPDGPIDLRRYTATIEDEAEDGDGLETSEVEVDETLELDGTSVRTMMTLAHANWDALCWLCWSVGLDRVALPEAVTAVGAFATAVNDAMARCFRAHDQLRTSGLASRTRGVKSFQWRGRDLATLPRSLAEVAAAEYRERRAVFFWLMFPQNVSPFQSDLRKV